MYADSSYYRQIHTAKQRGIKENTICHTLFFESVGGETFIENMIPTVVAVTDVNNDGIEYVFGRKALWFANLSYTDKGFSVFYDIKRWVGDFERKEELTYFDKETNKGMLLPARADGIVYMDNKAVYERRILKEQDILEIGKEKFIYVAFEGKYGNLWQKCIEEIEWYKEKEKEDKKTGERLRKYRLLKKQMINEEEKLVKVSTQIDENTTKLMFLGIIKVCDIQSNGDVHELSLEIVSQSIAMEKKEHFRTFQKTITSYEEILELIVKDYDKGAFINTAQKQGTLK